MLLSVLLQFALHIVTLVYITNLSHAYEERGPIDLEAKFEPNLLNTAIYLLGLSQQVSTFAINFQGRPFREGIRENSALYWGLVGAQAVAFSGSTDFLPELNRWLQIVEMKDLVRVSCVVSCWWRLADEWERVAVQDEADGDDGGGLCGVLCDRAGVQEAVCELGAEGDGDAGEGAAGEAEGGGGGQEGLKDSGVETLGKCSAYCSACRCCIA